MSGLYNIPQSPQVGILGRGKRKGGGEGGERKGLRGEGVRM